MKFSLLLATLLSISLLFAADVDTTEDYQAYTTPQLDFDEEMPSSDNENQLSQNTTLHVSVIGQGVSPMNTVSPAQAYALAKRAAIADGYRMIAEKVKGVYVEGQDTIKNMMVKRSTVRTYINATVRNANIVETSFKDGLCEVEMEIVLSYAQLR